ncbi:hypothetical protein ABZU86_11605 [Streptomyces sp. NPDC005271]
MTEHPERDRREAPARYPSGLDHELYSDAKPHRAMAGALSGRRATPLRAAR